MELTRRQVLAAAAATPVSLMLNNVARAAGGSVAGLAAEPSGTNPADLTVVELLPLLASRELSAAELVEACIARVERFDPEIKAFQHRTFERALAGARAADEARAARRPVGPLAGIPIGLKDMTYTKGVPDHRQLEGVGGLRS